MKKFILYLSLCLFLFSEGECAETLSFRLSDPHLYYTGGINYLAFDIQVKATADNTYLYSSQIVCNVNTGFFNTTIPPTFMKGFINGQYTLFLTTADKYNVTANWNSGNLNIAVMANSTFNGQAPSSGAYSMVTTSWQTLGTLYLVVSNSVGMTGISFNINSINGFQKYATGSSPYYSDYYTNPCLFSGDDLSEVYMGRIYSQVSGWTQTGGSMDWSVAVNTSVWDTASAAALISGTIPGTECKANNLRIHKNGRLKLDKDHPLTVTGTTSVKNANGIWITSDAAGTGSFINTGAISYSNGGTFKIERYLTANRWHYIDSPVQNALSAVFTNDYLRSFDEVTYTWSPWITGLTEPLGVMTGYEVWLGGPSGIRSFTGTVNEGIITKNLTYTAAGGGGWNLTGNPYPSAQDFGSAASPVTGWTWPGETDKVLYYLTAANGVSYQYETYSWGTGAGTGTATRYIPAMQGYFVKANSGSPVIGCNNSTRTHQNTPFFKSNLDDAGHLRMKTSGQQFSDDNLIIFTEGFSDGFDHDYDAYKFANSDSIPSIFSYDSEDTPLAIDIRSFTSQSETVKLGFHAGYSGLFSITALDIQSFDPGIGIILEDLKEHTFTDLRIQPVYSFSFTENENPARFLLHFDNPVFGVEETNSETPQIYSYLNDVYVKTKVHIQGGEIKIFDMMSRKVYENKLQPGMISKFPTSLNDGIYIVQVRTEGKIYSEKIYIHASY